MLELLAPAKLNLTLEVLGRRDDGYHEIVSIIQTIDLADRVRLSEAPALQLVVTGPEAAGAPAEAEDNLAYRVAAALQQAAGISGRGALIELEKRIPAGAGLGGGSSDAAAVLRGLNRLWRLDLPDATLRAVAACLGSDVPFFLNGGTAWASGRGEVIETLPDIEEAAYTLFLLPLQIEDKTRRMYHSLTPADFTDGARTARTAELILARHPLFAADLYNAFDRPLARLIPQVEQAMAACRAAGLPVFAAGAGPTLFSPTPFSDLPDTLFGDPLEIRIYACSSLSAAKALAVQES